MTSGSLPIPTSPGWRRRCRCCPRAAAQARRCPRCRSCRRGPRCPMILRGCLPSCRPCRLRSSPPRPMILPSPRSRPRRRFPRSGSRSSSRGARGRAQCQRQQKAIGSFRKTSCSVDPTPVRGSVIACAPDPHVLAPHAPSAPPAEDQLHGDLRRGDAGADVRGLRREGRAAASSTRASRSRCSRWRRAASVALIGTRSWFQHNIKRFLMLGFVTSSAATSRTSSSPTSGSCSARRSSRAWRPASSSRPGTRCSPTTSSTRRRKHWSIWAGGTHLTTGAAALVGGVDRRLRIVHDAVRDDGGDRRAGAVRRLAGPARAAGRVASA